MNKNKSGLALGTLLGLWHLVWGGLVAVGAAQAFLDFVYWMHFLNNPFTVQPFEIGRVAILVVVTFVIGYVLGWMFAWLWNRFYRQPAQ